MKPPTWPTPPRPGDVVMYQTGAFTASRAVVLGVIGQGATLSFIVRFLDKTDDQDETTIYNRWRWPDGGITVAARKCRRLTPAQQAEHDLIVAAYESGPLEEVRA